MPKPVYMYVGVDSKDRWYMRSLKHTEAGCKAQMLQDASKASFADLMEKGWRVATVEIKEVTLPQSIRGGQ